MNMSWGHKEERLTQREKAEIILNELDKVLQIDYNFKDVYIKAIEQGLKEIERKEAK
jgi:hypothetical protein